MTYLAIFLLLHIQAMFSRMFFPREPGSVPGAPGGVGGAHCRRGMLSSHGCSCQGVEVTGNFLPPCYFFSLSSLHCFFSFTSSQCRFRWWKCCKRFIILRSGFGALSCACGSWVISFVLFRLWKMKPMSVFLLIFI